MSPGTPPISSSPTSTMGNHMTASRPPLRINDLPEEALVAVFRELDVFTQNKIRRVCRLWNALVQSPSVRKYVTLDLSICLAVFHWLYTEDWCSAFMGPHTRYLTILCGDDLDNISDEILRYFFTEGCKWAMLNCTGLRAVTIVDGKIDIRCFTDLPKSVEYVKLYGVSINQPVEAGWHDYYGVYVPYAKIEMDDAGKREEKVVALMEEYARELTTEEMAELKGKLKEVTGSMNVTAAGILQKHEPRFRDKFCVDVSRVDTSTLRKTTLGLLYRLLE